MIRFVLDPNNPPRLSKETRARLDALTDAEITAAAESEPDNPPLTEEKLARLALIGRVRRARRATGLSQARFAETYHISLGRLRDIEQGRTSPDSALLAYLAVIEREPEAVQRALVADAEQAA